MSLVASYSSSEEDLSGNEDTTESKNNVNDNIIVSEENVEKNGEYKDIIEDNFDILYDDEEYVNPESSHAFNLPEPKVSYNIKSAVKSEILLTSSLPKPQPIGRAKVVDEADLDDLVKPSAAELAMRVMPSKGKGKRKVFLAPSLVKDDLDDIDVPKKKMKSSAKSTSLFLSSLPEPTQTHGLVAKQRGLETPTSSAPAIVRTSVDSGGGDTVAPPPSRQARPESSDEEEDADDGSQGQGSSLYFTFADKEADTEEGPPLTPMSTRDLVASTSSSSAPATAAAVVVAVDSAVVDTPTSQRGPAPSSSTAVTSEYAQYSNDNYRYADDPSLPAPVTNIDDTEVKLGEQELQRLHGRHKGALHQMHIIEADASVQRSVIGQTKGLTERESYSADHVTHVKFDDKLTKHKHHITYLAHMAKEREFELKNQWASDRNKRRETKNKYGF